MPARLPALHHNHPDGLLIGDTQFTVNRDRNGEWWIDTYREELVAWLNARDLKRRGFRTRTQALRAFIACVESDPPQVEYRIRRARLHRLQAGSYISDCGRYQVERRPDGAWEILSEDDLHDHTSPLTSTLRLAAENIAFNQARSDRRDKTVEG